MTDYLVIQPQNTTVTMIVRTPSGEVEETQPYLFRDFVLGILNRDESYGAWPKVAIGVSIRQKVSNPKDGQIVLAGEEHAALKKSLVDVRLPPPLALPAAEAGFYVAIVDARAGKATADGFDPDQK